MIYHLFYDNLKQERRNDSNVVSDESPTYQKALSVLVYWSQPLLQVSYCGMERSWQQQKKKKKLQHIIVSIDPIRWRRSFSSSRKRNVATDPLQKIFLFFQWWSAYPNADLVDGAKAAAEAKPTAKHKATFMAIKLLSITKGNERTARESGEREKGEVRERCLGSSEIWFQRHRDPSSHTTYAWSVGRSLLLRVRAMSSRSNPTFPVLTFQVPVAKKTITLPKNDPSSSSPITTNHPNRCNMHPLCSSISHIYLDSTATCFYSCKRRRKRTNSSTLGNTTTWSSSFREARSSSSSCYWWRWSVLSLLSSQCSHYHDGGFFNALSISEFGLFSTLATLVWSQRDGE